MAQYVVEIEWTTLNKTHVCSRTVSIWLPGTVCGKEGWNLDEVEIIQLYSVHPAV